MSVCIISYNHESYIGKAIEGVIMQNATFNIEIIIGEDFSTDKTRQVCQEYSQRYPDKIKLLNSEKNLGAIQNFIRTLMACSGQYIALCEGDDYWIDPNKLQKQVNFLESNPDFIVHHHNVMIVNKEGNEQHPFFDSKQNIKFESELSDYLLGGVACKICSMVFRWNQKTQKGLTVLKYLDDNVLYAYLLSFGYRSKYSNELMACYRIHQGGIWSLRDEKTRGLQAINTYKGLLQVCKGKRFLDNQLFTFVGLFITLSKLSSSYKERMRYNFFAIKYLLAFRYLNYRDIFSLKFLKNFAKSILFIFVSVLDVRY
ncbi:MAG: glycosyltransferase [Bacteroidales bacterium]|nr:glycosyltransferase [Bacteroidales bacterium]